MLNQIKKYVKQALGMGGPTATTPDSVKDLIARIREKKLTYLTDKKLLSLSGTCQDIEKRNLDGLFLEAGCALGGSSILMASIKSAQRPLLIYDVFGMIPPPTDMDTQDVHDRYKTISEGKSTGINGEKYYGYEANLYEIVLSNFRDFDIDCEKQNVQLIKGLLQETMTINQPVAFAHIDVDWYEPVMTCLTRIFPHLIVGGSIILDDYHDWGGCRKAADEYLQTVPGEFLLDDSAGSMKITRTTSKPA